MTISPARESETRTLRVLTSEAHVRAVAKRFNLPLWKMRDAVLCRRRLSKGTLIYRAPIEGEY